MTALRAVLALIALHVAPAVLRADPAIAWWRDLDAPSFGSAAAADVDRDGLLEVVFGTYFNDERIHALNGEDGSELWVFPTGGCNDASVAIADVDQDGELEVVVPASSPYTVWCLDGATGAVEWETSTGFPNCIDSPPAVADLDDDGRPEVVFGTFYGHVFSLDGEDGGVAWRADLGDDSFIQTGPNVLDLDGDGRLDVVVAQWRGDQRVYALRGGDGSELWHSDAPTDWTYHGGSFADLDGDGRPEIVMGCYDGEVRVHQGESGDVAWSYPSPFYVGAPTSLADLDGDGEIEIVFFSWNVVGALSPSGGLEWSRPAGGGSFRGAAIADVDGDGGLDVIYGADDGRVHALRGTDGSEIWTIDLQAHHGRPYPIDHAPLVADFDGDGVLDVFVVGGEGTSSDPTTNHGRAYLLRGDGGNGPGWTTFRHDLRHSACFSCCVQAGTFAHLSPADGAGDVPLADTRLAWSASAGAESYRVLLGEASPPPLLAEGLTVTELAVGGLAPGTTYHWRVEAVASCGREPAGTGPWSFTTTARPGSIGAASLRVARSGAEVTLTWARGCGAAATHAIDEGDLDLLRATRAHTHGSRVCADAGGDLTETFTPGARNRYFLVVPVTVDGVEGDHGPGRPRGDDAAACGFTAHDAAGCG
jgi:outer membrane protein assembly factor BamB